MRADAIFIDTWGWITLGVRSESRHKEIKRFYHELHAKRTLTYTSDYVLSELVTLLFRRVSYPEATGFVEGLLASVEQERIRIERINPSRFEAAWRLRKQVQDKPGISFTDLSSMVIMRELGVAQVLTEDAHFAHVGLGFVRVP
jgi:predicted nucleic acid-binding protein